MAEIILDLNYIKVEEIPSEDPEKPATLVFERKKRGPKTGGKPGERPTGHKQQRRSGKPKKPQGGNAAKPKPKEADPLSPFAVLANLKSGKK